MAFRDIDPKTISRLLDYSPDTGALTWKARPSSMFKDEYRCHNWNRQFAGKPALHCIGSSGYREGAILGRAVKAHRAIWAIMMGAHPEAEIDHINGDRADNRWCNLRCVSAAENMKNKRRRSDNISGVNGVTPYKKAWRARIRVNGKEILLGYFRSVEEAARARLKADRVYRFHENHGRGARN